MEEDDSDKEEAALQKTLENHPHLSRDEVLEFREIFNLVDLDRGGSISIEELGSLMKTLGFKPSQAELNQMVLEIDEDGNGEIDFDEFIQVMSRRAASTRSPDEIKAAFKLFQQPGNPPGYVSMAQLETALTTYGTERLSLADAHELLSQIETDDKGLVNYVEFVDIMTGAVTSAGGRDKEVEAVEVST